MKINYIKNTCHLYNVFNMFYECLEIMLHCCRMYIDRFCIQQRILFVALCGPLECEQRIRTVELPRKSLHVASYFMSVEKCSPNT
jgi:hypothetical protein